jgi:hypothetical protein
MTTTEPRYVQVNRDGLGPFDGAIIGNALAYTFLWTKPDLEPPLELSERAFVLLDLGVQLSCPKFCEPLDSSRGPLPWHTGPDSQSWYVDLITVAIEGDQITIWDLYIDVTISTDGRGYRLLDLEEYGEALESGDISLEIAIDGMKRWQAFLDRHLHHGSYPVAPFPDFPPAALDPLIAMPGFVARPTG